MKDLLKHTIACRIAGCLAAFCLAFVSCTSTVDDGPQDSRVITFQAPQADTRAVVENGETLPADFRVWGWHGTDGTNTDNIFDATVVYKDAGWNYTDGVRYWKAGETYNFYAVYPVFPLPTGAGDTQTTSTVTADGTITVTNFDCSQTGKEAVDLMTAIWEGVDADEMIAGGGTVTLTFQHLLARVTCKVAVVNSEVTVNSLRLYGVGYQGNYSSALTPSWSVTDTCTAVGTPFATDASFTLSPTDTSREKNVLGDLLLLPQDLQEGAACFVLAYRHNGLADGDPDCTVTVPLPAITWEAGSSYNYTLTIQAGVILNVSVKDWDEESTSVSWGDDDTTTGSGS